MSNLNSLHRKINNVEKNIIINSNYKYSKSDHKKNKSEYWKLYYESEKYLEIKNRRKDISNENRSFSQKINHANKLLEKSTNKKEQSKIAAHIKRLKKAREKNEVLLFKISNTNLKIKKKYNLLKSQSKWIKEVFSDPDDKHTKKERGDLMLKKQKIDKDISDVREVLNYPVREEDISRPISFSPDEKEGVFYDEIPFWLLKEEVNEKIKDELNSFITLEITFPLGRFYEINTTDLIQIENILTKLNEEIDLFRQKKNLKSPIVFVEYNYNEKTIKIKLDA